MLNLSKQVFAAWDPQKQGDELPEAELVAFGDSANEKKKVGRLTSKFPVTKEFENIPLPGFTLYKVNRKAYGSADPTWLVIDPRGFLVRITSENLEDILHITGITEGLIQEKCVWARQDSHTKMTLIPVNSPDYLLAEANTKLIEEKISAKDVQLGDKILLQNELVGIYLGTMNLYGPLDLEYSTGKFFPQEFLKRHVLEVENNQFHYQSGFKILKVVESAPVPWTKEECLKYVNDKILSGGTYFTSNTYLSSPTYYNSRNVISHVSDTSKKEVILSYGEIDYDDAEKYFNSASILSDSGVLLIESGAGKKFLVNYPSSFSSIKANVNSLNVIEIKDATDRTLEVADKKTYYGSQKAPTYSLDMFKKFYIITKHVGKGSYV